MKKLILLYFIRSSVLLCFLSSGYAQAAPTYFEREFEEARSKLLEMQSMPRSVAVAYRCFQLKFMLPDPKALDRLLLEVLESPKACPVLKGHAEWFLALLEIRRGEISKANDRQLRLGLVRDWWVVGPFNNEGKSGFDTVYPPEKVLDLAAAYEGKEREVRWRPFPPIQREGDQNLGAIFRPNLHVCAYALAGVQSDRQQPVAIRVGSDDAIKVWLNGRVVLSNAAYRPLGFDQDCVGGVLRKGLNLLLVKVCQKDGNWSFRLRLTTPEGGAISGLKVLSAERLKGKPTPSPDSREEPVAVISALDDLRRYVEEHPDQWEARRDLGNYLEETQGDDIGAKVHVAEYEKALELHPDDAWTLLRLAGATEDHNQRHMLYERALAADARFVPALVHLANYYGERGDKARELEFLRRALEVDPDYFPVEVLLAKAYVRLPVRGLAWGMLQGVKRRFPNVAWVDYQMGEIGGNLQFWDEAAKAYECYLAQQWTDNGARQRLLSIAVARQDLKRCLNLYGEMLRVQPDALSIRKAKALLLANNGKVRQATEELEGALVICPEDAGALEALGNLHQRSGKLVQAIECWRKSLNLHPQNPELQEYLEYFTAEEDPFEVPYLVDAAELAAQPVDATRKYKEDAALVLAEIVVQKLHPNGATSRFTQKVIRVLTEKGAEEQRYHRVYYSADKEMATVESYRVLKLDGRTLISGEIHEQRVVEGEQNTFYDYRVKILQLPRLEEGDVVELRYRVSDIAARNYFGEHFGELEVFQSKMPIRSKKYILIAPPARKLFYHQERVDAPELAQGDWAVYLWTARDVPGIPPEPLTPALTSIAPYVHVSSFRDWKEVAAYYASMVRDQFQVDEGLREAAQQITQGQSTDMEKIQALYHYLSRKTRYVGLEFGIHGYLPYPAPQVFARKYGDCKDKAVLLATMLRTVGIDAEIALVRTRLQGELHAEPASLAAFDHCICYVPRYQLWLDCTTEFNGTGELPDMDRGALALLIRPDGKGELRRPPVAQPEENAIEVRVEASLSAQGQLTGKGEEVVTGAHCPRFREIYQKSGRHQEIFEGIFRRYHPNARVIRVNPVNVKELEKPVRLEFEFRIPDFARAQQRELQFRTVLLHQEMVQRYAPLSQRTLPLEFFTPWLMKQRLRIALPQNIRWHHAPGGTEFSSKFGFFRFSLKAEGNSLTVEEELLMNGERVDPQGYPAFREFCQKIDEKRSEAVRVELTD